MRKRHSLIPNQQRHLESLFQTWLLLPETHFEIHKELLDIDLDLANLFNETVTSRPKVLMEVDEDKVPPRSPNRRRKLSEGF
jgi:hypothetical protein